MVIDRIARSELIRNSVPGKVVILLGARRVGKTFLINEILKTEKEKYLFWNGEDYAVHELLQRRSIQNYKKLIMDTPLIVIDEAQKIPEIGLILKLLIDSFDHLRIIVTGSSSFDLNNITGEPLTGRRKEIQLFPLSESEYRQIEQPTERFDNLKERLVYGNMPELINYNSVPDKQQYLRELVNSYLLKDILVLERIKNSSKIFSLLKLIAFQCGSEVSLQELGKQLSMSKNTVERYLDLLSKVFIIYNLKGFSRNLRKEVVKNSKWYFYDNGIRNAIIANFSSIENRTDLGILWENYMMSERIKYQNYFGLISNNYFWRTYDKQEIDLIEEREGNLFAYEFKWSNKKTKPPVAWTKSYPKANYAVITQNNYYEWLDK